MKNKLFDKMLILLFVSCMIADDKQEKEILTSIFNTKKEIESIKVENKYICADKKCLFLAFWDFDGTIIKGDCSEGLLEKDNGGYKGLIELGILKDYAKDYKGEDGHNAFLKKFKELYQKNPREAYIFSAKIFNGKEGKELQNLAREYFKEVLWKYYFPSSIHILENLKSAGIESYIISASPDFFVKGSIGTIPVNPDAIYGIELIIHKGIITQREILPVTYGDGKKEKIIQIVDAIQKGKKADRVFILAGFGNSFSTDGSFLKYIAEQKLDAGKPIAVMINGGTSPSQYKGIFKEVTFDLKK